LIEEGEIEQNKKEVETIQANPSSRIPSEFTVEIYDGDTTIAYPSKHTFRDFFTEKKVIGIEAPKYGDKYLAIQKGTRLRLQVAKHSITEAFDTSVEVIKGMLFVHYDENAMAMHSQMNFTIGPKLPIPVSIMVPSVDGTGKIYAGKILELSRIRLGSFRKTTSVRTSVSPSHSNSRNGGPYLRRCASPRSGRNGSCTTSILW
jgi:hypothetical protein